MLFLLSCGQKKTFDNPEINERSKVSYDSLLARMYAADDYGMKKFVMAFLKSGSTPSEDSITRAGLQKADLQNITRMAEEGKLILAGPFFGGGALRGIYVFHVRSIEEAQRLTNTDPAIKAGALEMELLDWYGPAGLMAINELHAKLRKKNITD